MYYGQTSSRLLRKRTDWRSTWIYDPSLQNHVEAQLYSSGKSRGLSRIEPGTSNAQWISLNVLPRLSDLQVPILTIDEFIPSPVKVLSLKIRNYLSAHTDHVLLSSTWIQLLQSRSFCQYFPCPTVLLEIAEDKASRRYIRKHAYMPKAIGADERYVWVEVCWESGDTAYWDHANDEIRISNNGGETKIGKGSTGSSKYEGTRWQANCPPCHRYWSKLPNLMPAQAKTWTQHLTLCIWNEFLQISLILEASLYCLAASIVWNLFSRVVNPKSDHLHAKRRPLEKFHLPSMSVAR